MKKASYRKTGNLSSGLFCVFVVVVTGCAPSIRYTRSSGQSEDSSVNYYKRDQSPAQPEIKSLTSTSQNRLQSVVSSCLSSPYRSGGMSRAGFDCSGFVCVVFKEVFDILLPHSSREMYKYGRKMSLRNASAGDLVFFKTRRIGRIDHVGIYMGDGRFAHASVKHGVIYSALEESYYAKRFASVRRIFQ